MSLETLIDLYDAWGKPGKAAEWRAKLSGPNVEMLAPAVDPGGPLLPLG